MGFLALAALIPAWKGEIGTSLCMLAADYLLDSQERKDRENQKIRTITEIDHLPILRWAMGKEWVLSLTNLMKKEECDPSDVKNAFIERWNEVRGNSIYLYDYEPFHHNFMRIAQKWIDYGCPN